VSSSFSKISFNYAKIAVLALCLNTQVALFEPLDNLVPFLFQKLVLPLLLYFLFFISAAGEVEAASMLPALEVGVDRHRQKWELSRRCRKWGREAIVGRWSCIAVIENACCAAIITVIV
jgi:hypothetical protein